MTDEVFARDAAEWEAWLDANHETAAEVWLVYWKKASGKPSIKWAEAVEVALKFGWIDGVMRPIDDVQYAQRWTPRRPKSKWSKVNREIALRHIASGEMRPLGLAAVEAGKASGEWDRAYTVAPARAGPRRPEGAAEGEPRREGAAAPRLPHALGPLARLARGGERRRADAAAERDREGARDEGLHGGRRCRSALRAKRTALSITIEPQARVSLP